MIVIPAKAGIHDCPKALLVLLDSRLRGNDEKQRLGIFRRSFKNVRLFKVSLYIFIDRLFDKGFEK